MISWAQLKAIVDGLAECEEPTDMETGDCVLCGEYIDYRSTDLACHAVDCPWRMAVELLR
jgi:hypothetical protein